MFALRKLYFVADRVIVRTLRARRPPIGPNPGLDRRVKAFQEDGLKIVDDDAEEFVEQSESDIYKIGEAYNEHMNETLMGKYEMRHQIIKEKYFKENMPNLLTWSEKEQIRHLCNEHPDEWTPERVAESFPVTVPVVKKLLKYPWKPASETRIARHDASAVRNWRDLQEGILNIPAELREHFLKFSKRNIPPLNKKSIKMDFTQDHNMGEFEKIIQKCAAKENNSSRPEQNQENSEKATHYNYSKPLDKKSDKKIVTLNELATKIKNRLDKGNNVDIPDQLIINAVKDAGSNISNIKINETSPEIGLEHHEENEITTYEPGKTEIEPITEYPERIRIPKNVYKKGATYKVNDCYYDHDGKFLYRVLGMSN